MKKKKNISLFFNSKIEAFMENSIDFSLLGKDEILKMYIFCSCFMLYIFYNFLIMKERKKTNK